MRAWKSLHALRDDAAAKPWLLTIVRRENARFFERKRLETVDIDDLTPAQSAMVVATDDSEVREVRDAIYRLEDEDQWTLEVVDAEGTSHVWNELFDSDREARDTAIRALEQEGPQAFMRGNNVVPFRGR